MDEILLELQAKLDEAKSKRLINDDILTLQDQINKLKLQAEIDSESIKNITEQLSKILNQKIIIDNVQINANQAIKAAEKSGQQVGEAFNQNVSNTVSKANKTFKSFSELKIGTGNIDAVLDKDGILDIEKSLNKIKETYSDFGRVRITNKLFDPNGNLQQFRVEIQQTNNDLKESRSFMMALSDEGKSFCFPEDIIKGSESFVHHLNESKKSIEGIQNSIVNGDFDTKILSYETSLQKLGISSNDVKDKMNGVVTAYANLKSSASSDHIIPDDVIAKTKTLENEMSKLDNTVKQIKLSDSLKANDLQIDQTIIRLNDQLRKNSNYTKEAKEKLNQLIQELEKGNIASSRLKQINFEAKELHSHMDKLNKVGQGFFEKITSKLGALSTYLSAATILAKGISTAKNGIVSIKELDTALVDLKKTTTMSAQELEDFYYASTNVAKQMGVSTEEIINQAAAWSRFNIIDPLYGDI